MNEIINSLFNRKSTRAFTNEKVSKEIKDVLIDSALQAPTAGNQIMYSIIDVTDEKLKEELVKTCDNQPFIAKAPLVFIFTADHTRWINSYKLAGETPREIGKGDLLLAITDTAIAAQNMVVAAESLGLGSCYIGDIIENCEKHREMLNLPLHAVPVCMLVIGYPEESQIKRKKPQRFDKKFIVGENSYPHLSNEELVECYTNRQEKENMAVKPFNEYMKAFCNRKYNSEFSKEMTRSANVYLKEFE